MKKIVIIIIALLGIVCIGSGILSLLSIENKTVFITAEHKNKKAPLNIEYQQTVINQIEKAFQNGYQVPPGITTEKVSTFYTPTLEEANLYSNCDGTVQFINTNQIIHYQLDTKCKEDTGNLKLSYNILRTPEIKIDDSKLYEVTDGYIISGKTDYSENSDTGNSLFMKFDQNHQLQFSKRISDVITNNQNLSSNITINDIWETSDSYYVLGVVEHAVGGDFASLLPELNRIYQKNNMTEKDNSFDFLFQYDKKGNLVSKNIMDPIEGAIYTDKIIGYKNKVLYISNDTTLIRYQTEKRNFRYQEYPTDNFNAMIIKGENLYGYSNYCNYKTKKGKINQNALIHLDLGLKQKWILDLENKDNVAKESCSNYINEIYSVGNNIGLVYNHSRAIGIYNQEGKQIKELDYSKLRKKKDDINIYSIKKKNEETEIILNNSKDLIVDRLDKKYELKARYSVELWKDTCMLENVYDIENMISTNKKIIKLKLLKGNTISIMRIDYDYT